MTMLSTCHASWGGAILTLQNALFQRQYAFSDGQLRPLSFRCGEREWIASSVVPSPVEAQFTQRESDGFPVGAARLEVELQIGDWSAEFCLWENVAGCAFRVGALAAKASEAVAISEKSSGVENDAPLFLATRNAPLESFTLPRGHFQLIEAGFRDQSDVKANLCAERTWLLAAPEAQLEFDGVAFRLENNADGSGLLFFKHAPIAEARPAASGPDFRVAQWRNLEFHDGGEWCAALAFKNGIWGRCEAIQNYSRAWREVQNNRDGLLLSNTWGDRSRDAHLSPEFMAREIAAGARLGVEIVQIDDGWQTGITANSARSAGKGAWDGFWESNPQFWEVNRERFPNGLADLRRQTHENGMELGLWFAPDCSHDSKNWRRDAEALLTLHREDGVNYFKIDALKIVSSENQERLRDFFDLVLRESAGKVTFDLDITAEKRFGVLGLMEPGPLFVENRYTDWTRYFPHQTLRVLWTLCHWLDPLRLRLEWLNYARNDEKYGDDALKPSRWQPDALFATVLLACPLGWFEVQHLPESYFEKAAPLIALWKQQRAELRAATTVPLGAAPDGFAWTGFWSLNRDGASFALIFREANPSAMWEVTLPEGIDGGIEVLAGQGTAHIEKGRLQVKIELKLGFLWIKLGFRRPLSG